MQLHGSSSYHDDASARASLHYGWWDALVRLRRRVYPHLPFGDVEDALWRGERFIREWAAEAEIYGCQPIHILRPPGGAERKAGGLAWRWTDMMEPIGFQDRRILAAGPEGMVFVYGLGGDGSVRLLVGQERQGALDLAGLHRV
ncbi:hypothetical protein [Caulobacter sp. 17J65-9]|uniref:hypothetical protein n=1 Tax=Caulobacter sp. 17J65-9 TaxID=2709382 RepID=UPI0013CA9FDE|nr:hypothetical protein [Caulobacter sp. 17J65-9]NEX91159.1 hypothetical protein [Caulobacter sp. 17J65-9]